MAAATGNIAGVDTLRQKIRKCYTSLVKDLQVHDHVNYWFQEGIIELDDKQRIMSNATDQDKASAAIDIILAKSDKAVSDFKRSFFRDDNFKRLGRMIAEQDVSTSGDAKTNESRWRQFTGVNQPDLRRKLVQLLCQGELSMDGENFYILVKNGINRDLPVDEIRRQFKFVKNVPWRAVFDFDDAGSDTSLFQYLEENEEQVFRAIVVDDIQAPRDSARKSNKSDSDVSTLRDSSHTPWIFTNGYAQRDQQPLTLAKWKKSRIKGFREILRFLNHEIPEGRAVIVFMLLSNDTAVMLEAADELCTTFTDQWCVLAESSEIAESWAEAVLQKELVDNRRDLDKRSVFGMPWLHVNETINQLLNVENQGSCELPSSSGSYITVAEVVKNGLVDLDILGRNQCRNSELNKDESQLQQHRIHVQQQFYKGIEVDWWNFHFQDQVRKRDVQQDLMNIIEGVITGRDLEDNGVEQVTLYHQPGAGGSTTARHALWELKNKYRCAVVRKITDQTVDQLIEFHSYKDKENPQPVLLLFDNQDEDKVNDLKTELEGQLMRGDINSQSPVAFVFLVCSRKTTVPRSTDLHRCILRQELTDDELFWFKNKYKELETKYHENKGIDPRHLISFNILKENFNPAYVKRTVDEILRDVQDPKERTLLLYISLLNSYDLGFQFIPASSFDSLMESESGTPLAKVRWECHLCQPLKLLLYQKSRKGSGQDLRIFHKLLSDEILQNLMATKAAGDQEELLGDLMLNFLRSDIFQRQNDSVRQLLKVIRDIVVRRARKPDGWFETSFAPLIETIVKDSREGIPKAADVALKVFDLTDDAFVAQQIARLYIAAKNWAEAIKYGRIITQMRPNSSFLWDTYGRVYKEQVAEYHSDIDKEGHLVSANHVTKVLKLTFQAVDIFRKVQTLSEGEKSDTFFNTAGYLGLVKVVVQLLDCLKYVEGLNEPTQLHEFLVGRICGTAETIRQAWGQMDLEKFRNLEHAATQSLAMVQEECFKPENALRKDNMDISRDELIKLKAKLCHYYGENEDIVPDGLSEELSCYYRRRRVFCLTNAFNTFGGIFDLRNKKNGEKKLNVIKTLVLQNVQSSFASAVDLSTLLIASMASPKMNGNNADAIQDMARWSKTLYEKREGVDAMEPYMFALLFNWPRKETTDPVFTPEIPVTLFQEVIQTWDKAYTKKQNKQGKEHSACHRRCAAVFYLGMETGMKRFVFDPDFRGNHAGKRVDVFQSAKANKILERWNGTLVKQGDSVQLNIDQAGNKIPLEIQTAEAITKRGFLNKRVYFVIGFTWSGPRAFGVTHDCPNQDPGDLPGCQKPRRFQLMEERGASRPGLHDDLRRQQTEVDKQSKHIAEIKQGAKRMDTPLTKKEQALLRKEKDVKAKQQQLECKKQPPESPHVKEKSSVAK